MELILAYILLYGVLPVGCYLAYKKSKAETQAETETPTETETQNPFIGEIFRTLSADLKRAGECTLATDAAFIANKADGKGWRGTDLWENGETEGVTLYQAAVLLQEIANATACKGAVRRAAKALYELNEGIGA